MIDWAQVNALRNDMGAESFPEIFALFLEEVEGAIERLGKAHDQSTLQQELHFLKGCALNIGFDELSQTCRKYEQDRTKAAASDRISRDIETRFTASKRLFLERFPMLDPEN